MSLYKPKAVHAVSEQHNTAAGGEVQVPRAVFLKAVFRCQNDNVKFCNDTLKTRYGFGNGLYALLAFCYVMHYEYCGHVMKCLEFIERFFAGISSSAVNAVSELAMMLGLFHKMPFSQ